MSAEQRDRKRLWMQRWRSTHPIESSYSLLKSNAKRRGKVFTISLDYFRLFCYETNYIGKRGRTSLSYSVDRIIDELGYVEGNIQIRTVSENSKKEIARKKMIYNKVTSTATVIKLPDVVQESDLPF